MPKIPVEKMKTSHIKKKIWEMFSKFIRLRDANDKGYCRCITCDKVSQWNRGMDAGHYVHGKHPGTWLNVKNVHAQCVHCNKYNSGMRDKYALALEAKYGMGILQEIEKDRNEAKETWTRPMLYEKYKELKGI